MHPQPESCWGHVDPIGPRTVHDEAKRCAEALTAACRTAKGADTAVVRVSNTCGPGTGPHGGRAIPTVVRQAPAGRPLTVAGDGRQTRSACHVANPARGTLPPARAREHGPVNPGD
ncbi:NAD-dependent epimerase/dehydratase family protein, partial [Actinosynnema sp. NPDC059797]